MTDFVTDHVRYAGTVKRYHTWPTIQTQTNAEHSWQVAMIYEQIYGELSPAVERYIRLHDVAELAVGDIPYPVKANNPELKQKFSYVEEAALDEMGLKLPVLHAVVRARIKICDLLEMMCFGMTEREMGNMLAIPIIDRTKAAAVTLASNTVAADAVAAFVKTAETRHLAVLHQERREA